jgi:hypothetical protein
VVVDPDDTVPGVGPGTMERTTHRVHQQSGMLVWLRGLLRPGERHVQFGIAG